ncbi:hypothetical protein OHB39_27470 [Streptomyces sp. NBC_00047]|uniref:hypothetical protein n=1 Tax=Streptomyces sp. NBC_00047 TaxID=2975627 RepID=UPI00225A7DD9|nr:hypothetical protein [Streptomyces sp. NBC_00047]MCX5611267.1 hypothetical protein [Streptomyces sp. NBC_00047]
MTHRLDPGAGWYGEFLRRDPEGVRACVDGAAMPPWDVVESLLRDLAGVAGEELAARETVYAARLRAAAVAAWDGLPGGMEELRTQYAAAVAQQAATRAALRSLTARLGSAADPAEADALTRELSWTQDDAARATARHEDLFARLSAVRAGAPDEAPWPGSLTAPPEALPGVPRQRTAAPRAPASPPAETPASPPAEAPVGRAEGRWLRGARRAGGARYAGSAAPEAPAFTPPPGHPDGDTASGGEDVPGPAPRGARFGRPEPEPPAPRGARFAQGGSGLGGAEAPASPPPPAGNTRAAVGELIALRAQGRGGEAHALLCEIAAWPADRLPDLAGQLARAGLAADWATLLWEAASLPPERLAAAAAALGESGREADCDRLLRQGVARPTAEIAEAALALGAAGRLREADALLGAFVRVRTAEEAAALARRDPQWFAPRLLQAAGELSATHRRDLVHALRVAGIAAA